MFSNTHPLSGLTDFVPTDALSTLIGDAPDSAVGALGPASTLSPSVLLDLQRFADDPAAAELLTVVAASVRHDRPLSLSLELDDRQLELTLHPRRQVYYSMVDLCALPDETLARVKLVRVEPDADVQSLLEQRIHIGPLSPLLWHLALRGAHSDLLPEISGPVRCRVALGVPLSGLLIDDATKRLIQRMKGAPVSVEDLLIGTQLGRTGIQRIWNALYLQSALMVSRRFTR